MDEAIGIKITFILALLSVPKYSKQIRAFGDIINPKLVPIIKSSEPVNKKDPDQREAVAISGVLSDKKILPEFQESCMNALRDIPCVSNIAITTCDVSDIYLLLFLGKNYG